MLRQNDAKKAAAVTTHEYLEERVQQLLPRRSRIRRAKFYIDGVECGAPNIFKAMSERGFRSICKRPGRRSRSLL